MWLLKKKVILRASYVIKQCIYIVIDAYRKNLNFNDKNYVIYLEAWLKLYLAIKAFFFTMEISGPGIHHINTKGYMFVPTGIVAIPWVLLTF